MKVRYGLSEAAVAGLGSCELALPVDAPDKHSGRRLRELLARVLSCRMRFCPHCQSADGDFLQCRQGAEYLKAASKCSISALHARSFLSIHARFSPGAVDRAGFRVRRIWVGASDAPHSFVAAHIDVESHLSRVCGAVAGMGPVTRLYALLMAINILHPFEDGNGRLMRAMAFAFSIQYRCDFFAFLAIHIKLMQQDFVYAMEMAADGVHGAVQEFHFAALDTFERLGGAQGGLDGWARGVVLGRLLARP
ncbi:Fic family protein [Stenotrophomonas maltophilia]|uniref:Fic family protein n=1 Tax=Stenotrophomonas maltophilia TaxID=40324 RepID=UPI00115D9E54|nr:Fic family protein [Stenotrophomonas maltophilia]